LLDSFLNILKNNKSNQVDIESNQEDILYVGGILLEAAAIDGQIDDTELNKVKSSLVNFFQINEETSNNLVEQCLSKEVEINSFHYFTSKINKEFNYEKKIKIVEMLWEIILVDGKIHDFESSLITRVCGLLYLSGVDCGNAKKRAENNLEQLK